MKITVKEGGLIYRGHSDQLHAQRQLTEQGHDNAEAEVDLQTDAVKERRCATFLKLLTHLSVPYRERIYRR